MKKKSVLIVEDDFVFAKTLFLHLQKEGYCCTLENDMENVLQLIENGPLPDVFLLDYELGARLNGLDLCRMIKARVQRPVLMLTGDSSEDTTVRCLDAGADQYLVKPYNKNELLARMRSAQRSYSRTPEAEEPDTASQSELRLDRQRRRLYSGERQVALTEREAMLLELLLSNLGIEMSRENVHFSLYGSQPDIFSRSIDVLVGRVRKKLNMLGAPYSINHLRSFGYVLEKTPIPFTAGRHEQAIASNL